METKKKTLSLELLEARIAPNFAWGEAPSTELPPPPPPPIGTP